MDLKLSENDLRVRAAHSLSADELREAIPDVVVLIYKDLYKLGSLENLGGRVLALLYPTQGERVGHWVMLWYNMRDGRKVLNFFCPYGAGVDQIIFEDRVFKPIDPVLSAMILEQPYDVFYNEHGLQRLSPEINTCGRWLVLRARHREMTEHEFYDNFGPNSRLSELFGYEPDLIVTMITS